LIVIPTESNARTILVLALPNFSLGKEGKVDPNDVAIGQLVEFGFE